MFTFVIDFVFQYYAKRLAGKNISYFVSGETYLVNQYCWFVSERESGM